MIFRILMLLLLVGFVFWILKKQFAADDRRQDARGGDNKAEDMLVCETCGVHTPRSMTVQVDGKTYCCEEHARSASPNRSADDD